MKYRVLYTHQKSKKAKTWQDGYLKQINSSKLNLLTEDGRFLESVYMKVTPDIGEELESDGYLITIEEVATEDASVQSAVDDTIPIVKHVHNPAPIRSSTSVTTRKRFIPPIRQNTTSHSAPQPQTKNIFSRYQNVVQAPSRSVAAGHCRKSIFTTCSQLTKKREKAPGANASRDEVVEKLPDAMGKYAKSAKREDTKFAVSISDRFVGEEKEQDPPEQKPTLKRSLSDIFHVFSSERDESHNLLEEPTFLVSDNKVQHGSLGLNKSCSLVTIPQSKAKLGDLSTKEILFKKSDIVSNSSVPATGETLQTLTEKLEFNSRQKMRPSSQFETVDYFEMFGEYLEEEQFPDMPANVCNSPESVSPHNIILNLQERNNAPDKDYASAIYHDKEYPKRNTTGLGTSETSPQTELIKKWRTDKCSDTIGYSSVSSSMICETSSADNKDLKLLELLDESDHDLMSLLEQPENTNPNKRQKTEPRSSLKFKAPFLNEKSLSTYHNSSSDNKLIFSRDSLLTKRREKIPLFFNNSLEYKNCILRIVYEHLNVQLCTLGQRYFTAQAQQDQQNGQSKHPKWRRADGKDAGNRTPKQHFDFYKQHNVRFYKACEVLPFREALQTGSQKKKYKIILPYQEKYSAYNKDDIWILSPDSSNPAVAKSLSYSPNSDGMLILEVIQGKITFYNSKVDVIHAFPGKSELSIIEAVSAKLLDLPIAPALLRKQATTALGSGHVIKFDVGERECEDVATTLCREYGLNEKQEEAVMSFITALKSGGPAVTCIHGVFGAGKSFMIAVLVIILRRVLRQEERIFVTATTNVAVDNILMKLLLLKFDKFLRVGSTKKVHKEIIPFLCSDDTDKQEVLSNVGVVASTCASSTTVTLPHPIVILDEASQTTEAASLLPLLHVKARMVLLVGDPQQLAPTVETQYADGLSDEGLGRTLFSRMALLSYPVIQLNTQYRCHPEIANISNLLFYNGSLVNDTTGDATVPSLSPVSFVSCSGTEENYGDSYCNKLEVEYAKEIVIRLQQLAVADVNMALITLYRGQEVLLRKQFSSSKTLKISTVDAVQGAERDVIVLSCVRSTRIGFADCHRRVNVALTRAKHHLIIIGNLSMLSTNGLWGKIIQICADKQYVYTLKELLTNALTS